jgi:circadian clock protein KaiC
MTALTTGMGMSDQTETALSSLVDTWIVVELELKDNVRRRTIHIVKSRGMEHSHETRQLKMSTHGLAICGLNLEAE